MKLPPEVHREIDRRAREKLRERVTVTYAAEDDPETRARVVAWIARMLAKAETR